MKNIENLLIDLNAAIDEAIVTIQRGGVGIALVVDKERCLIGTVTDGDIRRAILNKIPLDTTKVSKLLERRPSDYPRPVTASVGTAHDKLLATMTEKVIRQIPLLDCDDKVVELALLSELVEDELFLPVSAVVMAGGIGQRLHPLTKDIPKPMLPLEERPLIERTIEQLRKSGITKVNIATCYKSEVITKHFGNGDTFGVDISYINEDQPLGTAGALGLMERPNSSLLVVNGDVLTQLDYRAMLDFHHLHKAVMTVGVRKCDFEVPYGVIEIDDIVVKDIIEKPVQSFIVNAGIYLLESIACDYIPKNHHFDMTDLVNRLVETNHKVICFPIQEYWLDIGRPMQYQQAKEDVKNGKI